MLKESEYDADSLMVVNQESSSNEVEVNVEDVEYATISGTAIGSLEGILTSRKLSPLFFCLKFFGIFRVSSFLVRDNFD